MRSRPGLGDLSSPQTINALATTGASTTLGIVTSLGLIGGPVGAALAGIVAVGSLIANQFHGCGQTCVAATQIVEQVGPVLDKNLSAYLGSPIRYKSMQAAALNNFDTAWAAITQACSNPALGSAGKRCISDREQGACHYRTTPGGWQQDSAGNWNYVYPGANGSGDTCWNFFVGYRDPIANDPAVQPDPTPASTVESSVTSTLASVLPAGLSWSKFMLPAGLVALALLLPED